VRDLANSARAMLVIVVGGALVAAGLYFLADAISGDLTPLVYFAMIGLGSAALVRGLRAFRGGGPPSRELNDS
jgi:hypothetical protein